MYYYSNNWSRKGRIRTQVLEERDGSDNLKQWYTYGNYIDELLMRSTAAAGTGYCKMYLHDHLYSPVRLIDTSGNTYECYEYDAYGEPIIHISWGDDYTWLTADDVIEPYSAYGNKYLFTGREVDLLNGGTWNLQYNRNRYYDYYTGRWLTQDPAVYQDGLNLYEYVRSNPIDYLDNYGLKTWWPPPHDPGEPPNLPVIFVDKATYLGPEAYNCGGFMWKIKWMLQSAAPTNGYIIQNVNVSFDVKDCSGNIIPNIMETCGADPSWWPLWEAWKISKGSYTTSYSLIGYDDNYQMSGCGDCTQGSIKMEGLANFYSLKKLPPDFQITGQPPTWDLPATRKDPQLFGGSSFSNHNALLEWNCCPGSSSKSTKYTVY